MNKIIALTLLAALPIMAQSHHHCGTPMPPYNHYAAHHHGKPMMPPHGVHQPGKPMMPPHGGHQPGKPMMPPHSGHQPGKPVTPPHGAPGVQQPDKPVTPPNGTPGVQQPDKPATPPNQVIPSRRILPIVPGNGAAGGNTVSGVKKITVPTTPKAPEDRRLREIMERTGSIRY